MMYGRCKLCLSSIHPGLSALNLQEIIVRPVRPLEEPHYQEQMQEHHYLGSLPKIGETLWYLASWHDQWVALLSFSTPAWKCAARDRWIGWDFRHQYDRLHLVTNNSRFLILPHCHASQFGLSHSVVVPEKATPRLAGDFRPSGGACWRPSWTLSASREPCIRQPTGSMWATPKAFARTRQGYSATAQSPKMVFLQPLQANAQSLLSQSILQPPYRTGGPKIMLKAEQMRSSAVFLQGYPRSPPRPRTATFACPLSWPLPAGAILCGMRGYQAISDWAKSLGQKARERFDCRRENGRYLVPSLSIIRDVLIRVDPCASGPRPCNAGTKPMASRIESLAIDGKTMCNAIDEQGHQTHIMSVVGHQSKARYTQKSWHLCP